jgi:8-oxo-dGTP pyrophosphatase MutT (NUDIX family)
VDTKSGDILHTSILLGICNIVKITEVAAPLQYKAGIIPYFYDRMGTLLMMFMVPSDPKFGGSHFQIAKGGVDETDASQEAAAVREGEEELGLSPANIKKIEHLITSSFTGRTESYKLSVYLAHIKDPMAFGTPHFETGKVGWLTAADFASKGRGIQNSFVQLAAQKLQRKLHAEGQGQVS